MISFLEPKADEIPNFVRPLWEDDQTEPDEQIWRYMSVERLTWLLTSSKLYFASATQFADRFEGATAIQRVDPVTDTRFPEADIVENAFHELRRLTKINCWHRAEYESDAMWKLYAALGKGVAICSSPERIREAVRPFRLQPQFESETVWIGPVRYSDLAKVRLRTSMENRFFFKHQAFAWEREYRIAISLRSAEEFAVPVPEFGIEVGVDVVKLVDRIIIGPEVVKADRTKVEMLVQNSGCGNRLELSSLLWYPRHI